MENPPELTVKVDKLVDLLVAQRDEHVNRVYSLNGQVSILILTLSATIFFGAVSGVDKLSRVQIAPYSLQFWFLYGGVACLFLSIILISLALIQHGRDRGIAARHLESTIAELITGAPPAKTLEALAEKFYPLVYPNKRTSSAYLSSELNSRWLGLSMYEKTFCGCVFLLLAALSIATSVIIGYKEPPKSAAQIRDAVTRSVPGTSPTSAELVGGRFASVRSDLV